MRLRTISSGLIALCLTGVAMAATVYKWTDANGTVHFSDQPQPGAERIVTKEPNTVPATPVPSSRGNSSSQGTRKAGNSVGDYSAFEIDAPMPDQTFQETTIDVRLHLEPALA